MDFRILDLARFRPAVSPVRAPGPMVPVFDGLAQVRAYWEALRRPGAIPARAALDPRGLSGVLDRVFIAERIGRGLAQVRIAGSGLAELARMDLRGLPLSCLFVAESRPELTEAMEHAFCAPAVVELDLASDRSDGRQTARLLLLPLSDDQDRKLVLGTMGFADGRPARGKFQVLRRREERLNLPTTTVAAQPQKRSDRRFGHLTLVHSRTDG